MSRKSIEKVKQPGFHDGCIKKSEVQAILDDSVKMEKGMDEFKPEKIIRKLRKAMYSLPHIDNSGLLGYKEKYETLKEKLREVYNNRPPNEWLQGVYFVKALKKALEGEE